MAKSKAKAKGKDQQTLLYVGAAAVVAIAVGVYLFSNGSQGTATTPPAAATPAATSGGEADEVGVGPKMMSGQTSLLNRLLELLQEVDSLRDPEAVHERRAAATKVEAELAKIELEVDASTPTGAQQAGLISMVRSALQSDKNGEEADASTWTDDALLKEHGVVTYAAQAYWDEAYAGKKYGESHDWYGSWNTPSVDGTSLANALRPLLKKDARILMLGCGNSNMSALMYNEGYERIANVDIAEAVIEQMQTRYGHLDKMSWHAMSGDALKFADGEFDVVIEKGMFDALFAGTGTLVQAVLEETRRVLKPGGRLISVTFSGDRIGQLFGGASEGEAPEPGKKGTPSCKEIKQIKYDKADKEKNNPFYIFTCEEPSA